MHKIKHDYQGKNIYKHLIYKTWKLVRVYSYGQWKYAINVKVFYKFQQLSTYLQPIIKYKTILITIHVKFLSTF